MGSPCLAPQVIKMFLEIENAALAVHSSFQVQPLDVKLVAASNTTHETVKCGERKRM